jgi:hypothetical protein
MAQSWAHPSREPQHDNVAKGFIPDWPQDYVAATPTPKPAIKTKSGEKT